MNGLVLVADDSAVVRLVLARELQAGGWRVIEAADGAQALERCRQEHPDIVLLDIQMPRLNGFQVLAAMQADSALADIPVIFLTARDSSESVAEGLRLGAQDYLRKPFQTPELVARLMVAQRTKALRDELRLRNEELERLATTDVLTGLHNRRSMQLQLEAAMSRAARRDLPLSLLLIDVDHFKAVNDTGGHAAGDAVLADLAQRLRGRLRAEDSCGRWGGEEFLVVLPDTDAADALAVAEGLRAQAGADGYGERGRLLTISIGVAEREPDDSPEGLVQRADAALYAAKAAGRDTIRQAAAPAAR
jgi:two-component system cell cycle response regulator